MESHYRKNITYENGEWYCPAFIDTHCHLREPGYEYKEDISSGTRAAKNGGYEAIVAMPNTLPCIDTPELVRFVAEEAEKQGHCRVYPAAAITKGQLGRELCDFDALAKAGAVVFTDDGRPVQDASVMLEAMRRCAKGGYIVMSHCEDMDLSRAGESEAAEAAMIARDIALAEITDCRLHICHVSTAVGVGLIRAAKQRRVRVTAETCPHYFALTAEDGARLKGNGIMNPPLRTEKDRLAVIQGLEDGTIDCIATDHAPHAADEKQLPDCWSGVIGLETAFAASQEYLVRTGRLTLSEVVYLLSEAPARVLNLPPPRARCKLLPLSYTLTEDMLTSKSHNSPFIGMKLFGRPVRIDLDDRDTDKKEKKD